MACLDTSCLLDLNGKGGKRAAAAAEKMVRRLLAQGETLTTTLFSVAELWVGVEHSVDRAYEADAVERLLSQLIILDFTEPATRIFARVKAELYRCGNPVPDMDVLISSVALAESQCVVTRNVRHFEKIRDLKVITY